MYFDRMKRILLLLLAAFSGFQAGAQDRNIQVMTFNIRMNTPKDSINAWPNRKDRLASQVLFHRPQLLGVQEALWEQMQDLQKSLPQYKYLGVGRTDGDKKGEFSAIFYDTTRLKLLESHTFWLSETPETIGAKGWDAAIERIVSYGKFRDNITGETFFHFNTHFDHMGKIARRESAKLLLDKVSAISGKLPAVVTGDFNATPDDEPIRVIVDAANPKHLKDAKSLSQTPHYGPTGTFNGFRSQEIGDDPIDYIFLKGPWKVLQHATISQTWKGLFASDHFSVIAKLQL